MSFHFGPEVLQDIADGNCGSLSEAAGGDRFHVFTELLQLVQVAQGSLPTGYAVQDFVSALCPDTTWGTLPTALKPEEVDQNFRQVDHASILITDEKST